MFTRRPPLQRAIIVSAACIAAAVSGSGARAAYSGDLPLSTAIQLLVPEGYFVAYRATVDTSEEVRLPHHGTKADRLSELLSDNGLAYTVTGDTYSVYPIGSPTPTPAPAAAAAPQPSSYDTPGFSMGLPPPPPPPMPKPLAVAPVVAVAAPSAKPADLNAVGGLSNPPASFSSHPMMAPPPPPPPPTWQLIAGTLISKDLQNWGSATGWQVEWQFPKDFTVPANTTLQGEFPEVVSQVVDALRAQLEVVDPLHDDIHADEYTVNHVIIINTASESANNGE